MNLIDTDILIDAAHNKTDANAFLHRLENSSQPMAISIITYLELAVGCRNKREQREVQKLPTRFDLLHIRRFQLNNSSNFKIYPLISANLR